MGKATILEQDATSPARYRVQLVYGDERIQARIAHLEQLVAELEGNQIPEASTAVSTAQDALDAALSAEASAIGPEMNPAEWRPLADKRAKAQGELAAAKSTLSSLKLKKSAAESEIETLRGAASAPEIWTWVADYEHGLEVGSTVPTVEINAESAQIKIAPGKPKWAAKDHGILVPPLGLSPESCLLAWGLLPGVQRWRPTHRVGRITAVHSDRDTCDVCLKEARSIAQQLPINPTNGEACTEEIPTPSGHVDFCNRNAGHPACSFPKLSEVEYTPELAALLSDINAQVNGEHPYQLDAVGHGVAEYWKVPATGEPADCEDYALRKMEELLDAGIPRNAIRLTYGYLEGQGHLWLEVMTSEGPWALDNNVTDAVPASDLPYGGRCHMGEGGWFAEGLLMADVPVEYMDCNAGAMAEGREVIVELQDHKWDNPLIIGYSSNPVPCSRVRLRLERDYDGHVLTPDDMLSWVDVGNPFDLIYIDGGRVDKERIDYDFSNSDTFSFTNGRIRVGFDWGTSEWWVDLRGMTPQVGCDIGFWGLDGIHDRDFRFVHYLKYRNNGPIRDGLEDPVSGEIVSRYIRSLLNNKYKYDESHYIFAPTGQSAIMDGGNFALSLALQPNDSLTLRVPCQREFTSNVPINYGHHEYDSDGNLSYYVNGEPNPAAPYASGGYRATVKPAQSNANQLDRVFYPKCAPWLPSAPPSEIWMHNINGKDLNVGPSPFIFGSGEYMYIPGQATYVERRVPTQPDESYSWGAATQELLNWNEHPVLEDTGPASTIAVDMLWRARAVFESCQAGVGYRDTWEQCGDDFVGEPAGTLENSDIGLNHTPLTSFDYGERFFSNNKEILMRLNVTSPYGNGMTVRRFHNLLGVHDSFNRLV